MIARHLLLAGALAAAACGDGARPASEGLPVALQAPAQTTLLRLPSTGGTATAYRAADLSALDWKVDKVPPVRRIVGADLDQGLVYAIDSARGLFALDLRSRRVKPIQKRVRQAALGPDGSLYVVDSTGGLTMLGRRRATRLDADLTGEPGGLVGTLAGHLLVLPSPERAGLTIASPAEPAQTLDAPAGAAVATRHGDLVAVVAADGQVAMLDPARPEQARTLEVRGKAKAVAFSPSGHRLYVAEDRDELAEFDRYADEWRDGIALPGPARAVRADIFGTRLLVRPASGDSVWVVDPAVGRHVATVPGSWATDLPLVVPPSLLVVRRGADVAGIDISGAAPAERGRLEGAAGDLFLTLAWSPEPRDLPPIADTAAKGPGAEEGDSAAAGGAAPAAGATLYLQLSSSRNADWARELTGKLADAGIVATVLPPGGAEDVYRVVVGPYATREQADSASRRLGMPSFVITLPGATR